MPDLLKSFVLLVCSRTWAFLLYIGCLAHLLFRSWLECDPDLFTRMALGGIVVETGAVPTVDPFAWTVRLPQWIDHEWLSGVIFLKIHQLLGDWGLYGTKLLFVVATAALLRATYRLHAYFDGVGLAALMLVMFGSSFLWFSTVRCQAFTYLFLAFSLYAIESHRLKHAKWPLVAIVPIMIAWVNLHGGFTLGLLVVGLYSLCVMLVSRKLNLFLLGTVCTLCAVTLLNPYGAQLLVTVYEAISKPRDLIGEWGAVNPLSLQALCITAALGVVVVSFVRDRQRFSLSELVILSFCFYCGYRHARLMPVALFGFISLHAWGIERRFASVRSFFDSMAMNTVLSLYAAVLFVPAVATTLGLFWNRERFTLDYSSYPVEAITWAKENLPQGKMLTPFREGSYVLWAAYPHMLVSMDGRYEAVYPEETFRLNAQFYSSGNTKTFQEASELGADYALFPSSLVREASNYDVWWTAAYSDKNWTILRRSLGRPGHS